MVKAGGGGGFCDILVGSNAALQLFLLFSYNIGNTYTGMADAFSCRSFRSVCRCCCLEIEDAFSSIFSPYLRVRTNLARIVILQRNPDLLELISFSKIPYSIGTGLSFLVDVDSGTWAILPVRLSVLVCSFFVCPSPPCSSVRIKLAPANWTRCISFPHRLSLLVVALLWLPFSVVLL